MSGRFVSQDPTAFSAGDSNLYRYVGNHPSYAVDPTGLGGGKWSKWPSWLPRDTPAKQIKAMLKLVDKYSAKELNELRRSAKIAEQWAKRISKKNLGSCPLWILDWQIPLHIRIRIDPGFVPFT